MHFVKEMGKFLKKIYVKCLILNEQVLLFWNYINFMHTDFSFISHCHITRKQYMQWKSKKIWKLGKYNVIKLKQSLGFTLSCLSYWKSPMFGVYSDGSYWVHQRSLGK